MDETESEARLGASGNMENATEARQLVHVHEMLTNITFTECVQVIN